MSRPAPGTPGTCGACAHWSQDGTPEWARRMDMAICDQKRTNSITLMHFCACEHHLPARADVVAQRVKWLSLSVENFTGAAPLSGSFQPPTIAGHSRRDLGLFHGAAKGVK